MLACCILQLIKVSKGAVNKNQLQTWFLFHTFLMPSRNLFFIFFFSYSIQIIDRVALERGSSSIFRTFHEWEAFPDPKLISRLISGTHPVVFHGELYIIHQPPCYFQFPPQICVSCFGEFFFKGFFGDVFVFYLHF